MTRCYPHFFPLEFTILQRCILRGQYTVTCVRLSWNAVSALFPANRALYCIPRGLLAIQGRSGYGGLLSWCAFTSTKMRGVATSWFDRLCPWLYCILQGLLAMRGGRGACRLGVLSLPPSRRGSPLRGLTGHVPPYSDLSTSCIGTCELSHGPRPFSTRCNIKWSTG